MASVNKVILLGGLKDKPELRYTKDQKAVANFQLVTNEVRFDEGEKKETTEWHNIVVWGKSAENCEKYLEKGSKVYLEGKIKTRTWEHEGKKHYKTEIHTTDVQFLSTPKNNGGE